MNRYGTVSAILLLFLVRSPCEAPARLGALRLKHFRPRHDLNGRLLRGLRGEVQASNWSGYVVTAHSPYTSAVGTWQVPGAAYFSGGGGANQYAANWVGIGGFVDNDQSLIQLGTLSSVTQAGSVQFQAWYELLPSNMQPINQTINEGDAITASLQCSASCTAGATQTWQLTMVDATAGWNWSQTFQYKSSLGSVDWITEAPELSNGSIAPLADYGQATFAFASADGQNPGLTLSANAIQMVDSAGSGETSNPSAPIDGQAFSTCWGSGSTITSCSDGSTPPPPPPPPPSPPPPPPPPTTPPPPPPAPPPSHPPPPPPAPPPSHSPPPPPAPPPSSPPPPPAPPPPARTPFVHQWQHFLQQLVDWLHRLFGSDAHSTTTWPGN